MFSFAAETSLEASVTENKFPVSAIVKNSCMNEKLNLCTCFPGAVQQQQQYQQQCFAR